MTIQPGERTPAHERQQEIVRAQGMCGDLSPDGLRICILDIGHEQTHEWGERGERTTTELAAQVAAGLPHWSNSESFERQEREARAALTELCQRAEERDRMREALERIPAFDSAEIRHWLGSQDVGDVPTHIAQIAALVHAAMRARAALAGLSQPGKDEA